MTLKIDKFNNYKADIEEFKLNLMSNWASILISPTSKTICMNTKADLEYFRKKLKD